MPKTAVCEKKIIRPTPDVKGHFSVDLRFAPLTDPRDLEDLLWAFAHFGPSLFPGIRPCPWWLPAAVNFAEGGSWRTLKITSVPVHHVLPTLREIYALETYGASLVDPRGRAYAVAVDVDDADVRLLRYILRTLPRGARPWVTRSGGGGFHVWLYLLHPVPLADLRPFLVGLTEALAGLPCEVFPSTGDGTRCLKWPGSLHPVTGEPETFVDPRRPKRAAPYDDVLLLDAIRNGYGRTDPRVLVPEALRRPRRPAPWSAPSPLVTTNAIPPGRPPTPAEASTPDVVALLLRDERLARFVATRLGTTFEVGQSVRCGLHKPDTHPSATWIRSQDGAWLYRCHHLGETFDICALWHYVETGELRRLSGHEWAAALGRAAAAAGLLRPLVEDLIRRADEALASLQPNTSDRQTDKTMDHGSICLMGAPMLVWTHLRMLFLANADKGRPSVLAPVQHLADATKLRRWAACRALNWLAALGLVEKHSRGADRAQALTLRLVDVQEVQRRAKLLGSWTRCSKAHVAAVLGPDVAEMIFLRQPTPHKTPVSAG